VCLTFNSSVMAVSPYESTQCLMRLDKGSASRLVASGRCCWWASSGLEALDALLGTAGDGERIGAVSVVTDLCPDSDS